MGGSIPDVPELREEGDIRTHELGTTTEPFAFGFIGILVIALRGQLKEGNCKLIHRWFSLRLVLAHSLARERGWSGRIVLGPNSLSENSSEEVTFLHSITFGISEPAGEP